MKLTSLAALWFITGSFAEETIPTKVAKQILDLINSHTQTSHRMVLWEALAKKIQKILDRAIQSKPDRRNEDTQLFYEDLHKISHF